MNMRTGNYLSVIAAGFIVLVLSSLVLFSGRLYCFAVLMEGIPQDWKKVVICPSGLLPGEGSPRQTKDVLTYAEAGILNDPNTKLSAVVFELNNYLVKTESIGISRPYMWNMPRERFHTKDGFYYFYYSKNNYLLFDKHSGLFVYSYALYHVGPNSFSEIPPASTEQAKKDFTETRVYFAGPNGVSEHASASLGRFTEPITDRTIILKKLVVYDTKQRRFYLIDFKEQQVTAGPELARGDNREPVVIGETDYLGGGGWVSPMAKDVNGEWKPQKTFLPECVDPNEKWDGGWFDYTKRYVTVLDKSGRVYEVNTGDWSIRDVGFLPAPHSLYSDNKMDTIAAPRELLNYSVTPVYYALNRAKRGMAWDVKDIKYFGMYASSVSREGTAMAVAVFDPNGRQIFRSDTMGNGVSTARAVYSDSSLATTILFLLENIQPPIFEVMSYLSGNSIEASAGHRAFFILPNSFLGMLGRYNGTKMDREVFFPFLIGPSLILSVWLAFRVRKDAKTIGLSGTAKKWWTIGTIAFGLPAYITYRLTRPKEALVTCQNCGQLRRPDMEICHRCGSKWEMPELVPPNWRICD
jgi:hypothetical protein